MDLQSSQDKEYLYSLKKYLHLLFAYEKYPHLSIPKTNNAIESLNSILKMRLRVHRKISAKRRRLIITALLSS